MFQEILLNGTYGLGAPAYFAVLLGKSRGLWPSVFVMCDQSERTVRCLFSVYPLRHTAERDSCHYGYYRIGYVREIDGN